MSDWVRNPITGFLVRRLIPCRKIMIVCTGYKVGWFFGGQFFLSFFVVFAIFDLVHNVDAIFHLRYLLKASENLSCNMSDAHETYFRKDLQRLGPYIVKQSEKLSTKNHPTLHPLLGMF